MCARGRLRQVEFLNSQIHYLVRNKAIAAEEIKTANNCFSLFVRNISSSKLIGAIKKNSESM